MSTYDVTFRDHYRKKKSGTHSCHPLARIDSATNRRNGSQPVVLLLQQLTAVCTRVVCVSTVVRRLTMGMNRRAEWAAGHASAASGAAAAAASAPSSLAPLAASAGAATSARRLGGPAGSFHASGSSGGYLCGTGSSGSTPRFACSAVGWDSNGLPLVNNPSGLGLFLGLGGHGQHDRESLREFQRQQRADALRYDPSVGRFVMGQGAASQRAAHVYNSTRRSGARAGAGKALRQPSASVGQDASAQAAAAAAAAGTSGRGAHGSFGEMSARSVRDTGLPFRFPRHPADALPLQPYALPPPTNRTGAALRPPPWVGVPSLLPHPPSHRPQQPYISTAQLSHSVVDNAGWTNRA